MELKDYINAHKDGNPENDNIPPVYRKKKKNVEVAEKLPEKPVNITPEMTDDECLQFYVDLSNMTYMAINNKLRPIEVEEVQPVKTAAGNVIRTLMKYLGDYRFYLDAAVMTGFTIGIYKQRKAELPTENKDDKKDKKVININEV
jgi:hypothetical protein